MRASPESTRIGFVGLGRMGGLMAARLIGAGYHLTVHDRSLRVVRELVGKGAANGGTPAGVGRASHMVITKLAGASEVEQVLFGPDGVQDGLQAGGVVIDMSPISPGAARRIAGRCAARGVSMLDAAVSGGQQEALDATLSIMVGGAAAVVERCRPVLDAMGKTVVHVGECGAGQLAKVCDRIVTAVTIQAVAEAFALANKSGLEPASVREAVRVGLAGSRILELHRQRTLDADDLSGEDAKRHYNDLTVALTAAGEAGVPVPATALVHELFGALLYPEMRLTGPARGGC